MTIRNWITVILIAITTQTTAQTEDSTSVKPAFSVSYTSEMQSDFKRTKFAALLQMDASLPLSRTLAVELGTLSYATSNEETLVDNTQGYSNLDAENMTLALTKAGIDWKIDGHHRLFAGLRRVDHDYFCSDLLALFTNSTCGGFPTFTANHDIGIYPKAALGLHYAYVKNQWTIQASLYNGLGHTRFSGSENIFRFCPQSDGVFAMAQTEYRHQGSSYYLGGSIHNDRTTTLDDKRLRASTWVFTEQRVTDSFQILAICSHAFGPENPCDGIYGLGGRFTQGKMTLGLFTDYTKIDDVKEWATELTCQVQCSDALFFQPAFHILNTGGNVHLVGLLRMGICL